jgi:formate dehydrogenase assembly factor FdhD
MKLDELQVYKGHSIAGIRYHQAAPNAWESVQAEVIVETPVSLTVNNEVWLTFMCTPVDLELMAAGFLFNEGVVASADEIADVRVCASGDNIDVWLRHYVEKPKNWRRTSGCTGGMTSVVQKAPDRAAIRIAAALSPLRWGTYLGAERWSKHHCRRGRHWSPQYSR